MNLWGVAVIELKSHPDHNKVPDHAPCACPNTQPTDHIHTIKQTTSPKIAVTFVWKS